MPPAPVSPPIAERAEKSSADAAAPANRAALSGLAKEKSAAAADSAGTRLGTGHGQREWSVVQRTAFERATSSPEHVTQLEYDSRERLIAAGVIAEPQANARPQPFPSNQGAYVADPPLR